MTKRTFKALGERTVMGFDFGTKSIGIAIGQELTGTASSLQAVKAKDGIPDWQLIKKQVDEWQPDLMVVGLPLNMDDSESELSQLSRKFAQRLKEHLKMDVIMMDERLTSREIKTSLIEEANLSRGRRKAIDASKIDHLAAALILQNWLDNPHLGQPI